MFYIRDTEAWQPSIYLGWLLRQNPPVKYAMLEKTKLFRIFDNVSSKCLGLVVKETVCPNAEIIFMMKFNRPVT